MAEFKTNKLEIISRETIKPSSPTLPLKKIYKLSVLDQLISPIYLPIILFYPNVYYSPLKSNQLKNSLSKTLTLYYPLAGRVTDSSTVDCNDEGVDFLEAQMKYSQVSDILNEAEGETLNLLFPVGFLWKDSCKNSSLLAIQVTYFDCGGMTIGMCISHKIMDGCSISTFLCDWAAMTQQHVLHAPTFISSYVSLPMLNVPAVPQIEFEQRKCATRKFVFDASTITKLKHKIAIVGATSVEIVTAFLYKCATTALAGKYNKESNSSVLVQLVNMRGRVFPPLPRNSIGNFSWYFSTISTKNQELHELVGGLRNSKRELLGDNTNPIIVDANDWLLSVVESTQQVKSLFDDLNLYRFSSLAGTGFTFYDADFGWGNPVLVRMAVGVVKNSYVLFDAPNGDGIDAWVTLEEQDMAFFQHHHELLLYSNKFECEL